MTNREEPRIRNIIPEQAEGSHAPLDTFADFLIDPLRAFYQDAANEAEYQEWENRRRLGA